LLETPKTAFLGQVNLMNENILYPHQNAAQPPLHFCFSCRWEGRTAISTCPRCGSALYSQENVRTRGAILTFLGLFLSVFMAAIAIFVTVMLTQAAKDPKNGAKFDGEEHMLVMIFLIFGGVIAIGITMIFAGLWQVVFGRRNMYLIWIFFALIILTLFVGGVFRVFAG
jgi:hypothetical protein